MLAESLNRVGIILNFFAGFLLAPELVGIERMKKSEEKLNSTIAKLRKTVRGTLEKMSGGNLLGILFERNPLFPVLMTFVSALLIIWIIKSFGFSFGNKIIDATALTFYVVVAFVILVFFFRIAYLGLSREDQAGKEVRKKLKEVFLFALLLPVVLIFHAFIFPLFIIILFPLERILVFIIRKLDSDERLLGIVVF